MKLKDIRLKKNLSQVECAAILGISRRTYQNLEKDDVDVANDKYIRYCKKLESFSNSTNEFRTNVALGKDLITLFNKVKNYKKRDCFKYLLDYINNDYRGSVCILYGLRRTGKTTLLFQLLNQIDIYKSVYIKVNESNSMADLIKDINILKERGIKNYLIDEVTLLEDFINSSSVLSDIYSTQGLKIILSGTDSLGFSLSSQDELFDRNIMIHTSYISFKEFYNVLNIKDIDKYIEYGGTLKVENMTFDDPDYQKEELAFKDDESTRKYIDTAICKNIQRTLRNNHFGSEFIHLKELYDKNELTNAINRIIENMNHEFLLSVVTNKFKSHDLGSAKQLLLKNPNSEVQTSLFDIDTEKVLSKLKEIIEIKEKEELKAFISQESINQIKQYLFKLDLIREVEYRYDDGSTLKRVVFVQPGMRYSITKALVYALLEDKFFASLPQKHKDIIVGKILEDVKGRMIEDIVLLEKTTKKNSNESIFKYKTLSNKEIDMVIYDHTMNSVDIFEIKHSDKINFENQTKFLTDNELLESLERIYGVICNKYVLYRGKPQIVNGIIFENIQNYLTIRIKKSPTSIS